MLGIQTFGYKHQVLFPLDVTLADKGKPLDLKLHLDLLVCAEQCVPFSVALALTVPAGPSAPGAEAQMLAKARATVPGDTRASGMRILSAEEVSDKGAPALEVKATSEPPFAAPDLIPEVRPDANLGTPRVTLSLDKRQATFDLPLSHKLPVGAKLAGRDVTLTVTDGSRALEQASRIVQGASATQEEPGPSLAAMLAVALLGGLILNLMPCVLPVLSLKFISVVSQGGRAPAAVRAGFLATAAGIIVSFLVIAGALIGLKAAGQTIGWGIQFQEPAFIATMAVLVTFFACHRCRAVRGTAAALHRQCRFGPHRPRREPRRPLRDGRLRDPARHPLLGPVPRHRGRLRSGRQHAGDARHLSGAPASAWRLPYLVIAAVPQLATKMPKPGRWMLWLKQAMAIPLAATAVWLVSILATQIGTGGALVIAALLVAIVAILYWRDQLPEARRGMVFPHDRSGRAHRDRSPSRYRGRGAQRRGGSRRCHRLDGVRP